MIIGADTVIRVENVYKNFKLPHEKANSVKSLFTNPLRRKGRNTEVQHALKNVSFEIKRGEFFGIVGRNGSGKSTLLKMLAGIYQPTKGKLGVTGKLVPFIELGVGFNPELTGRQNVYLNGALLGFSEAEVDQMYEEIVDFAELHKFMDQKLKNYSSGMQVRLAFSMAVRAQADILLIDEVLAVGDADFQRKCFEYFKKLKKNKKTVVFVSHDMNAVREYCDRAVLIKDGGVEYIGSAEEIAKRYTKLFNPSSVDEQNDESKDKRWGDGEVKINSVKIKLNEITDQINIVIEGTARESIENPNFGFMIKNSAGQSIMGTNTKIKNHRIGKIKPKQRVSVEWSFPNILADGKHFVTIAVTHDDDVRVCDWWEDSKTITIKKDEINPYNVHPRIEVKSFTF